MTDRAPRYSRPIPASRLAPPPRRPFTIGDAARALFAEASAAVDRERVDHMGRIGFVMGGVACAAFVIVGAAFN